MAKVIEFYVPQRFRNSFVRAAPRQRGKVIKFRSQAKKPSRTRSGEGVAGWLLVVESNHAMGDESNLH
jgi:hypothetical protein